MAKQAHEVCYQARYWFQGGILGLSFSVLSGFYLEIVSRHDERAEEERGRIGATREQGRARRAGSPTGLEGWVGNVVAQGSTRRSAPVVGA